MISDWQLGVCLMEYETIEKTIIFPVAANIFNLIFYSCGKDLILLHYKTIQEFKDNIVALIMKNIEYHDTPKSLFDKIIEQILKGI